jgi:uncharacterized protein (PEP-CTERM system associated)
MAARRHAIPHPGYLPRTVLAAGLLGLLLPNPVQAQPPEPDTGTTLRTSAPSVLPDTGTTTNVDLLRQQLQSLDAAGADRTAFPPGWTVAPSIAINQQWTDHIQGAGNPSAWVTIIEPGVLATGDTERLRAVVSYTPDIEFFVPDGNQNRVAQNFNADGLITVIPEQLFVDLRGYGTMQSAIAGTGPAFSTVLSRENEVQTQAYSVHPYLLQHFGDWGSAELGANLSYTQQNTLAQESQVSSAVNQDTGMAREYLSLASGPQFGRISLSGLGSAMQANGSGVMSGAYRNEGDIEAGYAITRSITVLVGGGYQALHYGGYPNYNFTGPQWDGGIRWAPNADSSVTIRYARRDGVTAPEVDGAYAPSARSRIYLRYSEGIATDQELLQSAINASVLDPLGNAVDAQTGSPLLLVNTFYGVQNNVARVKRGSVTGTLLFDRDSFSVSLGVQKSQQLAAATLATIGNATTTYSYGSINWQHEFVGRVMSSAFFQYGVNNQVAFQPGQSGANNNTIVASLSLIVPIFKTLTGLVQYAYTQQSNSPSLPPSANVILVGIKKTF